MITPYKNKYKAQCYAVFEQLADWFGTEELNQEYTNQLSEGSAFIALIEGQVVGVISLTWHFETTAEIYSMAIDPARHRQGIGQQLFQAAEQLAELNGCDFLHVKTLGDELPHPGYKKTRAFYEAMGFKRLFQTTELWDGLPTMLYVKTLGH